MKRNGSTGGTAGDEAVELVAEAEALLADLQRKYGDDLDVVKGPFQHWGSWGCAVGVPREPLGGHGFVTGASTDETAGLAKPFFMPATHGKKLLRFVVQ